MDKLIYNRTEEDVAYAKNNQSSSTFLKGSYNYTDLNRIEEWCEYIATELEAVGYETSLNFKTNWSMDDFPTQAQLERIRSNVDTLKTTFHAFTNVPTNLNKMTYQKANDIEKILDEIYRLMWGTENWYIYSGVSNSGQKRLWQHRFRQFFTPVPITGELITTETGDILLAESGEELEEDTI